MIMIIVIKNLLKNALPAFCDYNTYLLFFNFKGNLSIKSEHDNGAYDKLH